MKLDTEKKRAKWEYTNPLLSNVDPSALAMKRVKNDVSETDSGQVIFNLIILIRM